MVKGKQTKPKVEREVSEEVDLLDTMLDSLVELLEEKGILTREEYEKRIMEKVKIK
jgi:DNA-binding HxlR family transcriptional regulator